MFFRKTALIAAAAATSLVLASCSNSESDDAPTTDASTSAETSAAESSTEAAADQAVTLEDGFVKEKGDDKKMTAIFGTLTNHTDEDVELVGFTTSLGEGITTELHETVDGTMRKMEGGMLIPANGTYELKPGGDHLMIMDYADPILAGELVTLTLEFKDGSTVEIKDLPVKSIQAGDEDYGADGNLQGHSSEHDMGGGEHDHDHGHEHGHEHAHEH